MLLPVTREDMIRESGISPLHLAAQHNENEILEVLLQARYDANALLSPGHSCMYQDRRTTALYFAVTNSNLDAAEMLLEAGADPNLDKFNPLLVAVRQGKTSAVHLFKFNPLLVAVRQGKTLQAVHLLDFLFRSALTTQSFCSKRRELSPHLSSNAGFWSIKPAT